MKKEKDPFAMIEYRRKLNKKKVFFAIVILLVLIGFCVYGVIQSINSKNEEERQKQQIEEEKNAKIEQERLKQEQIEKEKKLEQEKIIKAEEEKKLKTEQKLTEEQIQSIENIYDSDEKRVFLTFDDGPTESVTPFILDLLKKENIKATFFVLGNRVKSNPELIKREYDEGHYIANHGYTHKYKEIYQSVETVLEEYNYTNDAIREALNKPNYNSGIFRFPGGSNGGPYNDVKQDAKQYLKEKGIASLDWNALSRDAEGYETKEELFDNVIDTIGEKQNVVILMHDASDKILTYEILPDVINYLRENGYKFMNLYDVI